MLKIGIKEYKMDFKNNISMLFLIVLSIFTGCGQSAEESVIVVPKDYSGYILIVYDQEKGSDKEYKDKTRVYRIPSSGVLLSKFSSNPGWSKFPKFYNGSIELENEISFIVEIDDVPSEKVSAFGGTTGGASRDLAGKEILRYIKYYIGNQSEVRESIKELDELDIIKLVDQQ